MPCKKDARSQEVNNENLKQMCHAKHARSKEEIPAKQELCVGSMDGRHGEK